MKYKRDLSANLHRNGQLLSTFWNQPSKFKNTDENVHVNSSNQLELWKETQLLHWCARVKSENIKYNKYLKGQICYSMNYIIQNTLKGIIVVKQLTCKYYWHRFMTFQENHLHRW